MLAGAKSKHVASLASLITISRTHAVANANKASERLACVASHAFATDFSFVVLHVNADTRSWEHLIASLAWPIAFWAAVVSANMGIARLARVASHASICTCSST